MFNKVEENNNLEGQYRPVPTPEHMLPIIYVDTTLTKHGYAADAYSTGLALSYKLDESSIDNKSILIKDGSLLLYGFDSAQCDYYITKDTDGNATWKQISQIDELDMLGICVPEDGTAITKPTSEVLTIIDTIVAHDFTTPLILKNLNIKPSFDEALLDCTTSSCKAYCYNTGSSTYGQTVKIYNYRNYDITVTEMSGFLVNTGIIGLTISANSERSFDAVISTIPATSGYTTGVITYTYNDGTTTLTATMSCTYYYGYKYTLSSIATDAQTGVSTTTYKEFIAPINQDESLHVVVDTTHASLNLKLYIGSSSEKDIIKINMGGFTFKHNSRSSTSLLGTKIATRLANADIDGDKLILIYNFRVLDTENPLTNNCVLNCCQSTTTKRTFEGTVSFNGQPFVLYIVIEYASNVWLITSYGARAVASSLVNFRGVTISTTASTSTNANIIADLESAYANCGEISSEDVGLAPIGIYGFKYDDGSNTATRSHFAFVGRDNDTTSIAKHTYETIDKRFTGSILGVDGKLDICTTKIGNGSDEIRFFVGGETSYTSRKYKWVASNPSTGEHITLYTGYSELKVLVGNVVASRDLIDDLAGSDVIGTVLSVGSVGEETCIYVQFTNKNTLYILHKKELEANPATTTATLNGLKVGSTSYAIKDATRDTEAEYSESAINFSDNGSAGCLGFKFLATAAGTSSTTLSSDNLTPEWDIDTEYDKDDLVYYNYATTQEDSYIFKSLYEGTNKGNYPAASKTDYWTAAGVVENPNSFYKLNLLNSSGTVIAVPSEIVVGDFVSMKAGYTNCLLGKVTAISGNDLTVLFTSHKGNFIPEACNDLTSATGEASILWFPAHPSIGWKAYGDGAVSFGEAAHANGEGAFAEGENVMADGKYSHAEGMGTAAGYSAHSEGYETIANGLYSHAEGRETTASGTASHAEGRETTASGTASHAEGNMTTASGGQSHAEGVNTIASGNGSHAEGSNGTGAWDSTISTYSTSQGSVVIYNNKTYIAIAKTIPAGTLPTNTTYWREVTGASATGSHAEGTGTNSSGLATHAEGYGCVASGKRSHAEGFYNTTLVDNSHIQGKYAVENDNSTYKYVDVVGWGTSASARKNISSLTLSGDLHLKGTVYVNSDDDGTDGIELVPKTSSSSIEIHSDVSTGIYGVNDLSWVLAGYYSVSIGVGDGAAGGEASFSTGEVTIDGWSLDSSVVVGGKISLDSAGLNFGVNVAESGLSVYKGIISVKRSDEKAYYGDNTEAGNEIAKKSDIPDVFIATKDTTTYSEIQTAVNAGKAVFVVDDNRTYFYSGVYNGTYYFSSLGTGSSNTKNAININSSGTWTTQSNTYFLRLSNYTTNTAFNLITGTTALTSSDSAIATSKAIKNYVDTHLSGTELPTTPTTDGTYTLKCTVTDGVASYSWVADT